jgi:hypothetical protein
MFASKVGAYLIEASFRCSLLGLALGFTHKHETTLNRDKHSSLFGSLVSWRIFLKTLAPAKNIFGRLFGRFFIVFGRFFHKNIWSPWHQLAEKTNFPRTFDKKKKKIQTIFFCQLGFQKQKIYSQNILPSFLAFWGVLLWLLS